MRVRSAWDARCRGRFIVAMALALVAMRVLLADEIYLRLVRLPSHDMSQGLAFFTTSMHSVYLSGDIAWWSPSAMTGYPQYFQALFAPVAPTYGHVTFIAWTHGVALLRAAGIHVPEYLQYLAMNYLVLPGLAFASFGYFCSQFLRTRAAVAFAMATFALSGIGLWYGGWFYFQEPFVFFALLGASLAVLRAPRPANAFAWLAAVLVQFAGINYWTVYNFFFAVAVLGVHAAVYPVRWRRLGRRARAGWRASALARSTVAACGVVLLLWAGVILASFIAQAGNQGRLVYTVGDAVRRIQEMRRWTLELFDPWLARPVGHYMVLNELHNARYVGMLCLPLLLAAIAGPWDRRMRWLLGSAGLTLALCLGTPYGLIAWVAIPYMDRIQHVFYFYSQYWQLLVVLIAAAGLDRLRSRPAAHWPAWIAPAGYVAAGFMALAMFVTSEHYGLGDDALQSNVLAALLGAIAFLLVARSTGTAARGTGVAALLAFVALDLSAYYYQASRADMAFMDRRGISPVMIDARERAAFLAPWPETPDLRAGFASSLRDALPVWNDFWPANSFMTPAVIERAQTWWLARFTRVDLPFLFYTRATSAPQPRLPNPMTETLATIDSRLLVQGPVDGGHGGEGPVERGFGYRWTQWGYNGFEAEIDAPEAGWLAVRQLHDPDWRYEVDGERVPAYRANYISTAVTVPAGHHRVRGEYRPWARALYWWAAAALEIVACALLCAAALAGRARFASKIRDTNEEHR